jgi:hypothetical protein
MVSFPGGCILLTPSLQVQRENLTCDTTTTYEHPQKDPETLLVLTMVRRGMRMLDSGSKPEYAERLFAQSVEKANIAGGIRTCTYMCTCVSTLQEVIPPLCYCDAVSF